VRDSVLSKTNGQHDPYLSASLPSEAIDLVPPAAGERPRRPPSDRSTDEARCPGHPAGALFFGMARDASTLAV
jgi:hypothetical protein